MLTIAPDSGALAGLLTSPAAGLSPEPGALPSQPRGSAVPTPAEPEKESSCLTFLSESNPNP